ncbi:MAG: hypothetical protein ABJH06_07090, partial [Paraglaciecola sp.]|uniref:RIFT barrel domain-containing protein n=2 Tax=Paraglaciecola sp. TaxID=1920173 RepID=UPI0032979B81
MKLEHSDKHVIPLKITTTAVNEHGLYELAVPFPITLVKNIKQVRLFSNEHTIDSSVKICAYWSDGSVKWLFVSFFIEPEESRDYSIVI